MDIDKLVRIVVEEVMNQLKQKNGEKKLKGKKLIAVFTGGRIGIDEAFKEIKNIVDSGAEVKLALSEKALQIFGEENYMNNLPGVSLITQESILEEIRSANLILFPVLTQNTLVKMALGICDTLPLQIAAWGIMMGKKILAAKNSADPKSFQKVELGMGKAPKPYCEMIYGYIDTLEKYGIIFCDSNDLSKKTHQLINGRIKTADFQGRVLTQKNIQEYKGSGVKQVFVKGNSIITPLALEFAEKNKIVISRIEG